MPIYRKVKKVTYNNIVFDSKLEIKCYQQLKTLELVGKIEDLEYHNVCPIIVAGVQICTYELDFSYTIEQSGKRVACEVKGFKTAVFNLKWRLFQALYSDTFDKFEIWPECTKVKIKKKKG